MMLNETYTLSNGVKIPKLGLGTWFIDDDKAGDVVKEAVKLGYRLIDTAQAYGNERGVGEGVRNCGLPRNEIFVTSKVAAEAKSYESAAASIDETLSKMGLDYIDMMIIHSPQPWAEFRVEKRYFEENKEVWRALEDAYTAGKVKAIGVSNFLQDDLENILADCKIKPMVNQIECHPLCYPAELIEYCKAFGIQVQAYAPLARGAYFDNDVMCVLGTKYARTPAQIGLRWAIQKGISVIPKSINPERIRSNGNIFDFNIEDEDMAIIDTLNEDLHTSHVPEDLRDIQF